MIHHHSSNDMHELADGSVHCMITSPPYPMIAKWDECFSRQGADGWDKQWTLLDMVLDEVERVMIPGGIACINIGDATRTLDKNFCCYPNYAALALKMMFHHDFTPLIPIFWKKISNRPNAFLGSGFLPVNAYVSQDHEYIGLFRKGKRLRQFSPEEKERRRQSAFTKAERDLWFQQVWNIQGKKGARGDSGWPQEVPYRLMRMFSIIEDTILDPFCGPGKENLYSEWGRRFVGYEIN